MKNSIKVLFVVSTIMSMTLLGCGRVVDENKGEIIPTAVPTVPLATVTPAPTATSAPRIIGNKNSQSKFVYLTNKLDSDVRELYLMISGAEDWGKNLIPSEFSIKPAEQVQMFYTPESAEESPESSSEAGNSSAVVYDMKIVTAEGNTFEIYSVDLGDMEKAALNFDKENSSVYIRYMSLTEKKEKDTKGNSAETVYDNSSDYEDSSDGDYNNSTSDNSNSDDSSDDGYYEDSSNTDSGYDDNSSDEGSSDNSSDSDSSGYDDGNTDGGYDDGNTDDGSYNEGNSDDGYVDAGDGSDSNYDTAEGY